MNLIEKISEQELQMFDRYRKDYIGDVCGSPAPIKDILKYWSSAKIDGGLYKLLGENLMINKDIVSEKSRSEMEAAIENLLYSRRTFIKEWRDFVYEKFIELKLDIENPEYVMYYNMDQLMLKDALIDNTYNGETFFVNFPNGDKYKVQKGCKVSKALGKIADAFGLHGYEEFRIAHSQVLNEKQLKGTMTLSIHPLDYVTMSDNDSDWSSCMSWREDGEYRRGTVEMMNSPYVVIAYLNSSNSMPMGNDQYWSNKKWRELFIVDSGAIVGIKGYPYWNRNLEAVAIEWIKELAEKNLGNKYTEHRYTIHAPNNTCKVDIDEYDTSIHVSLWTDAMYNDCYDDHVCYFGQEFNHTEDKSLRINYSGVSECMWCGFANNDFSHEGSLACSVCDDELYCTRCGERIYEDDAYWVDGEAYCSYCYDELPHCDSCNEVKSECEAMYRVYLSRDNKIYKWYYADLCEDCFSYNDYIDSQLFKRAYVDNWRYVYYLRMEDIDKNNIDEAGYVKKLFDYVDVFDGEIDSTYWKINEENQD